MVPGCWPNSGHDYRRRRQPAGILWPRVSFGRGQHAGQETADCFRANGAEVVLLCKDSYAEIADAVDKVLASGVDALAMVGGDGMVHLGIHTLAGSDAPNGAVPLGIVPTGTGNDMARALGLPRHNIPAACDQLLAALASGGRLIDVGRVSSGGVSRWFAGVVSAGFVAAVNERANALRWPRGRACYNLAMLRELASFRAINQ